MFVLKCVPLVQHFYFSWFDESKSYSAPVVPLSLPLTTSILRLSNVGEREYCLLLMS